MRLWALGLFIGILLVQQLSHLPSLYWLALVLISLVALKPISNVTSYRGLLVIISGIAFGFSWGLGHAHWLMGQRLLPQYEGIDLVIEGQIVSLPESATSAAPSYNKFRQLQRVRFDFAPIKIQRYKTNSTNNSFENISVHQFPKLIRLSWYRPTSKVKAGEFWRFGVRLKRPHGMLNPGSFDYESNLYQKRIQAKGSIRNKLENKKLTNYSNGFSIKSSLLKIRQTLQLKLSNEVDIGEKSTFISNVTQSLILGYRGGINSSQWRILQRTGTIHLMAISGLHIGLIATLVYGLFGILWRSVGVGCLNIPAPQIAAVAALVAATLYAALAGFTIPTQRALIMLVVVMLHIIFKRTPLPVSKTVSVALIVVLLVDPLAVLSQGFWLSFLAVSLILYLVRSNTRKRNKKIYNLVTFSSNDLDETYLDKAQEKDTLFEKMLKRFFYGTLDFVRIQWVLTLALFPVVLYFYQSSSLISPIANFIAIPVVSFIVVPLMFAASFFIFINSTVANSIFVIINFVFDLLWRFLELLSSWNYATLDFSIAPFEMIFCYLGIVLWLCVKGTPMRWLGIILVLPLFFYTKNQILQGEVVITVLDVGQGLSTVIQTKEHSVVFDTGPKYSSNFDMGRAVVVPYLRHKGQADIDTLIISHGDNDHIGGFNSITELMPIKRVLTSIPKSKIINDSKNNTFGVDKNYKISSCRVGDTWVYDDVEFRILSPLEEINLEIGQKIDSINGHDKNNQSCVLKVSSKYGRALITGDIERETESHLYHTMAKDLSADVLIVPHHGSNTSSLSGFIEAVAPKHAVFTVGYRNRYKLPNRKVIKRYKESSHAKLYRSDETGAIIFEFKDKSSLNPILYRKQVTKYWHLKE